MKFEKNPYLWVAAGSILASTITVTSATDYQFGSQRPFSIRATDQGRERPDTGPGVFAGDRTGGVYDRDGSASALCDITYSHFDLSSLEGKSVIGDVSFSYSINATWGGAINDGLIATANAAWTGNEGSTTPGFTEIPDSQRITQNFSTYDTATWFISQAGFSSILANLQNFHGFAVTAGNASSAHFAALPTITGTVQDHVIEILNANNWGSASFDEPSFTLSISGGNDVSGGDVTIKSGATLTTTDSATLDGGSFSGTFTNNGAMVLASSADQILAGAISGSGNLSQSGSGMLTLTADNTYSGTTTVSNGTLQVGDGGTTGSLGTGAIINHGSLIFNRSNGLNLTTGINGTGSLTKSGSGTLTLTVGNGYTGSTNVDGGTLVLSAANDAVCYSSGLMIHQGTVSLQNYNPMGTVASPLGITPVTIHSGGVMTMNAGWSVNLGQLTLNGGELSSGGFFSDPWGSYYLTGDVSVHGDTSTISAVEMTAPSARNFNVDSGATLQVTGNFSNRFGAFGLIKTGDGTISLSGVNRYTGNTSVEGGHLVLEPSGQLAFSLTDSNSNLISGTASASFHGSFAINTSAVSGAANASWQIANVASQSFGPNFSVAGFTQQPDGVTWIMRDAKGTWSFSENSGILVLTIPSAGDYEAWATANGVTGGASDDDDSDGMKNFDEYAFGLDPKLPASSCPVTLQLDKSSGSFSYQRRKPSLTNLSYTVQTSTDLINWSPDSTAVQAATDIGSSENESVTVTLSAQKPLTSTKLFIRVVASKPAP